MVLQLSLLENVLETHAGGICHSSLFTVAKIAFFKFNFSAKKDNCVCDKQICAYLHLFSSHFAQKSQEFSSIICQYSRVVAVS